MPNAVDLSVPISLLEHIAEVGNWNRTDLANIIGVSPRTMSRWFHGSTVVLIPVYYQRLARAVYPHDAALAAQLADSGGTTLQALGLLPPPGPPAAPNVAVPSAARPAHAPAALATLASALVGNVAEQLDVSPRQVRPVLAAAFAEGARLGLSPDDLARAFGPQAASPQEPRA